MPTKNTVNVELLNCEVWRKGGKFMIIWIQFLSNYLQYLN